MFTVRNTGSRPGTEVAQVYAILPASTGEDSYKRLVGWDRVMLAPGDSRSITVSMNKLTLSIFDVATKAFAMIPGDYIIFVGSSSADTPLETKIHME